MSRTQLDLLRSNARFWATPPDVMQRLAEQFGPFDCDPCPNPRPVGYDGLTAAWGSRNYVNPPYGNPGPFVRRALELAHTGAGSLLVLPVTWWTHVLVSAGAELHPLGRVKWLDLETGEPDRRPGVVGAFWIPPCLSR